MAKRALRTGRLRNLGDAQTVRPRGGGYSGAPENCWLSRSGVQMCASDCTLEMGQEGEVGSATPGLKTP